MRPTAHARLSLQHRRKPQGGSVLHPPLLSAQASHPSSLPNSDLFVSLLTTPMVLAKGEAEYMGTLGTATNAHVRLGRKFGAVGSVRRRADPDGPGTTARDGSRPCARLLAPPRAYRAWRTIRARLVLPRTGVRARY